MQYQQSAAVAAQRCKPNQYLQKHQLFPPQITTLPHRDLGLIIVIPCHDEPDLNTTLDSLWACQSPECAVEIIVIINAAATASDAVQQRNRQTWELARTWIAAHQNPKLSVHLLHFFDLAPRHAGAGLARKLGMDEAVARFHTLNRPKGVIVALDADCRVDSNYLQAIENHFQRHPKTPGCAIYFEHPLDNDPPLNAGIIHYELFLRYYIHGLRFSGFPYAYHTVGSSMAVRSEIYQRQGGMNRRQAGEDFYFLHKIIPLGGFTELRETTVIPSARVSHRVPFGTGKAQREWLRNGLTEYPVYNPRVFCDLRALFAHVDRFFTADPTLPLDHLPDSIAHYLVENNFSSKLSEIQQNAASVASFNKRFYQWFNGFRVLKFIHWASASYYPKQAVQTAALQLLQWQGLWSKSLDSNPDAQALLHYYRQLDRTDRNKTWRTP